MRSTLRVFPMPETPSNEYPAAVDFKLKQSGIDITALPPLGAVENVLEICVCAGVSPNVALPDENTDALFKVDLLAERIHVPGQA